MRSLGWPTERTRAVPVKHRDGAQNIDNIP